MSVHSPLIGIVSDDVSHPHSMHMLKEVTRQLSARDRLPVLLCAATREDFQAALRNARRCRWVGCCS